MSRNEPGWRRSAEPRAWQELPTIRQGPSSVPFETIIARTEHADLALLTQLSPRNYLHTSPVETRDGIDRIEMGIPRDDRYGML